MRFYLDNDVDQRCRPVIVARGHDCWATSQAGRSDAADEDQAVYAADKDAVIVTHDAEFTSWRKRWTAGRHIRLCCEQPDAPSLLATVLPLIEPILTHREHVVIEVRPNGFNLTTGWSEED